jgi:23S rRNA (guanine745-N1)-methyltransferase
MLITLFAPYCGGEFTRVLAKKGIMIMAIPSRDHLWELKQAIYDVPYKNEVRSYELEGFDFLEKESIRYTMHIASQEELQALFSMTPYYYRTGKKQQERLVKLTELDITADFELLIYQKIERRGFDGT